MTIREFSKLRPSIISLINNNDCIFWYIDNPKAVSFKSNSVIVFDNELDSFKTVEKQKIYCFVEINNDVKFFILNTDKLEWKKNPKFKNRYIAIDFVNLLDPDSLVVENKFEPIKDPIKIDSSFNDLLSGINELLTIKNKKYGDAGNNRLNIFEGKCNHGQRIDEKISRILNSKELEINDVTDIIGYLILTMKEKKWTKEDILKTI
jgi:hypothetical protein